MPRREKPSQHPAERPEFPKPLVRLKADAGGPGGYGCEVRLAADSDSEGVAKEEGYATVDLRDGVLAGFQEWPKWVYHADGRRQIVHSQEQADELDGFTAEPPTETEGEAAPKGVPPPVAQATALDTRNRPPVPVDRG